MQRRQLAKIAATSFGGGGLPPHVSIKGNRFTLVDGAGNRRPMQTLHMDCVIVDINEKMTRIYWGQDENGRFREFNEDNTSPPPCFSDNGIAPSSRSLEPQAKTCTPDRTGINGCKWSVWGAKIGRDGKTGIPACQNGIKTALLIAQVQQAQTGAITAIEVMPMAFMLRVPPNSIDEFKSYGKEVGGYGEVTLPWNNQKENLDLPLVVTRVSFVEGEVGKLQFKPLGYINDAVDTIIQQLDDKTVDTIVGRDDVPWDGAMIETKPQLQISPAQVQALLKDIEAPAPQMPASEPPKPRGRPRKPPAESAPAPFATAPVDVPAQPRPGYPPDGSIPPFLQRTQETKPNVGQQSAPFGIQKNAPPPTTELDNLLRNAFDLPTK